MMQLIDSHCHLDDERFDSDREVIIERARTAGINQFIVPAVTRSGWEKLKTLSAKYDSVVPAYGMHPWFCNVHKEDDLQLLPVFLETAAAVGECGLDSGLCNFSVDEQLQWFRPQLRIAAELDMPVILHAYKTVDTVIHEIRRYPCLHGVVHSFNGSRQQADQLIDLGFHIGVGGAATYERATRLQRIANEIPIERLLIETDAPDQSPAGHRDERNEPALLIEIVERIATLRGMDAEELARICNQNARELFGI